MANLLFFFISAHLLPLVLGDVLKVGVTVDEKLLAFNRRALASIDY